MGIQFRLNKNRFGAWPATPQDDSTPTLVCLGSFTSTNDKCGQFDPASQADTSMLPPATRPIC